ncbi:unnamed protein product [Closterium sp. NIES-54]
MMWKRRFCTTRACSRAEESARREEAEARWRAAEQEADGLRRELAALLSRRAGDPGVSATGVGQERLGEAGAGMAGQLTELEREMAELRRDVGEVTRWVRRSEMRAREGWRAVEGMMGGMRRRMDRTRGEEGAPGGGGGVSSVGAEERAGERAGEESGDEAGRGNCEMREGLGDAWSMLGVWGGEVVAGRGSGNEGGGAWASELGEGETGCAGAAEGRWRGIGRGKERWGGRWERVIRRIGDVGARVQGERWQQVELEQQVERAGREVARVKALLGRAMGAEGKIDDEVGGAGGMAHVLAGVEAELKQVQAQVRWVSGRRSEVQQCVHAVWARLVLLLQRQADMGRGGGINEEERAREEEKDGLHEENRMAQVEVLERLLREEEEGMREVRERVRVVEAQLEEEREKVSEREGRMEVLESEVRQAEKNEREVREEVERKGGRVRELEEGVREKEEKVKELERRLETAGVSMREAEERLLVEKDKVGRLEERVRELEEVARAREVEETKEVVAEEVRETSKQVVLIEVGAEVEERRKQVRELEGLVKEREGESRKQQVEVMGGEVERGKGVVREIEEEVRSLRGEVRASEEEAGRWKAEAEERERRVGMLQGDVVLLQGELAACRAELARVCAEVAQKHADMVQKHSELAAARETNSELEEKLQEQVGRVTEQDARAREQEERAEALEDQVAARDARIWWMEKAGLETCARLRAAQEEVRAREESLGEMVREVGVLGRRVEEAKGEAVEQGERVRELEGMVREMERAREEGRMGGVEVGGGRGTGKGGEVEGEEMGGKDWGGEWREGMSGVMVVSVGCVDEVEEGVGGVGAGVRVAGETKTERHVLVEHHVRRGDYPVVGNVEELPAFALLRHAKVKAPPGLRLQLSTTLLLGDQELRHAAPYPGQLQVGLLPGQQLVWLRPRLQPRPLQAVADLDGLPQSEVPPVVLHAHCEETGIHEL